MPLQTISVGRASRELGHDVLKASNGSGKLQRLRQWLYGAVTIEGVQFRLAPSIILRSEAELLGVSSPRFAVRAYLTGDSFINARRRPALARSLEHVQVDRGLSTSLIDSVRRDQWIADSILSPPQSLVDEGFQFLQAELGQAYGEGREIWGTPFVTHMHLGGGLCAQAACFMVLALLQAHVCPVGGVAEITAMAQHGRERLNIGGMGPTSIAKLFHDPIRHATAHIEGLAHDPSGKLPLITAALRGYVSSGCPVILLVSLSRMFGDHRTHGATCSPVIVAAGADAWSPASGRLPISRSDVPARAAEEAKQSHAIVVVGWNERQDRFVINDPATYPFLPISTEQIVDIRRYRHEAQDGKLSEQELGPLQYISVVPKQVRLSLLNNQLAAPQEPYGLLQGSINLLSAPGFQHPAGLTYTQDQCWQIPPRLVGPSVWFADENLAQLTATAMPRVPPGTYWVQHIPSGDRNGLCAESLWFWDATRIDVRSALTAVFIRASATGAWQLRAI